jgi:hypothetical protein
MVLLKKTMEADPILSDRFIRRYTDFDAVDAFFEAARRKADLAGFTGPGDFDLGSEQFSRFVADHSRFESWGEMLERARMEWMDRRLAQRAVGAASLSRGEQGGDG